MNTNRLFPQSPTNQVAFRFSPVGFVGVPAASSIALLILISLGLGATGGCSRSPTDRAVAPPAALEVQTVQLERGSVARRVTLPALRVVAAQEAVLFAKVPGYLRTIAVDKGDVVQSGQLLAELEAPELTADVIQHKAEAEVARINFERLTEARHKAPDLVVPQTLDDLRGKWEVAQAQLQRIESLLQFARITAPFAGTITARFVDQGAFIPAATAGATAQSAALLTLMDVSRVRVQVYVPEVEVPFVRPGIPVSVTFEALPGKTIESSVARLAFALDPATRTMLTEIDIPNPERDLHPGMYGLVQFEMERKPSAWVLPVRAIAAERSGNFVFFFSGGKAKRVPIKTGFNDGTNVEITGGLEANQPVILLGKQNVVDGQSVRISAGQ